MQTSINIRISEKLKNDATHVLHDCGQTVNSAVRLFLEQVVHTRRIPFEVTHSSPEMKMALQETRDIEKHALYRYDLIDSLLKGLNVDEQQEKKDTSQN